MAAPQGHAASLVSAEETNSTSEELHCFVRTMPYNTVIAPSNIFPPVPDQYPPIFTTEARAAFVNYNRPTSAPQPYRGAQGPSPVPHVQPVTKAATPLMSQLQSLNERLLRLQKQLDEPSSGAAPAISQASIDAVAAQLAALEGLKAAPCCEKPAAKPAAKPPPDMSGSFESFAQFAAEASRVRNAGRLPFGSDYAKIRLS